MRSFVPRFVSLTSVDWLSGEFQQSTLKASVRSQSSEFTHRSMHYEAGDEVSNTEKQDETVSASSTALSLSSSTLHAVLVKWASMTLVRGSANEALSNATKVGFT